MWVNGITWVLSNFGLAMLIIALVLTALQKVSYARHTPLAELLFRWVALLPLSLTALYAFVLHAFFPDFTAATIGWQNSPFQFEVAMANFGFGVIALLAVRADFSFRLAAVIGNTCWLWGDAAGHVYQIITQHNYTVGNAGSWFWMDIVIPLILIICLIRLKRAA